MAEVLAVGLPTLAVLIGILVNNARLTDLRVHIAAQFDAERRANTANIDRLADRMDRLETRIDNLEKALLGKIEDIDNRLSRLEDRFGR
ncbi:MAG: hypothetical protein JO336_19000 [Acidobacteriia bacterium]|nr:hypothetical protein [Terriglobia bacterium]MBV8906212.1 hypothetical protein [Terriglobia bacterium]